MANWYDVGDMVEIYVTTTNDAGAAADPTTLEIEVKVDDGTPTVETWPGGGITRNGLGDFEYRYTVPAGRVGFWKWSADGAVVGVWSDVFLIKESKF